MKNIYPKITFHPLLLFFALLAIFTAHFQQFLTFMLIIFIHECGHLLFAFLFHWKIEKIIFLPFGGMIKFHEKLNRPIYQEFLIVLGGPLFQILFSFVYPTIYHIPLLIFNLLPIYPLDGSKILLLIFNVCFSYYQSYVFLVIFSYSTIFLLNLCYPSFYFLIFSLFLLFQQVQFMRDFDKQEGIAFFLIYFTARDIMYYMSIRELNVFWDRMENGGRKSFRIEELKDQYFMKHKSGQMVPYLDMIQIDLNERDS